MQNPNTAEMQNTETRKGEEIRVLNAYSRVSEPGWQEQAEVGLKYGSTGSGFQALGRTMRPTYGMIGCLTEGEMMIPVKQLTHQFVAGYSLRAMLERAGLKNEGYVDVWTTTDYCDFECDGKVCCEVTGVIRRYDIAKGVFEATEKAVTETFVLADPERDARNAAQIKKRRQAKREVSAAAARYDRRAAYGGHNSCCSINRTVALA